MTVSYVIKRGHDYIQCKQYGLAMSTHYVPYHKQATYYTTLEAAKIMCRLVSSHCGQTLKVVRVTEHDV